MIAGSLRLAQAQTIWQVFLGYGLITAWDRVTSGELTADACFHFPVGDHSCYPLPDNAKVWIPCGVVLSGGGVSSADVVDRRVMRGLQFGIFDHVEPVPGLPLAQIYREGYRIPERPEAQRRRRVTPGGISGEGRWAAFSVIAGTPDSISTYMDEYVTTSANYFVCSFQWGNLTHDQAKRSIDLFVEDIMPHSL